MALVRTAIGLLRQQLPPGALVHGIVTEGGQVVNVIPARARARYEVRAPSREVLSDVRARVRACFEAGAQTSGAELELSRHGQDFAELRQDPYMAEAYVEAARTLGSTVMSRQGEPLASTDMGNVSRLLPAIHPTIGYDTGGARQHTPEFTAHGKSPGADGAVLDGATTLALVGAELAASDEQRRRLLAGVAERHRRALAQTSQAASDRSY